MLDAGRLEWFSGSVNEGSAWRAARLEGDSPLEVARAAIELVQGEGRRPGRCILALGRGQYEQRLLDLPRMGGKELRAVLERKAANLLGEELEDSAFVALPVSRLEQDDALLRFFLFALNRTRSRSIQDELRAQGFDIVRVVSARMSLIEVARRILPDPNAGSLVVTRERDAVSISALHEGSLVQQAVLGDMSEDVATMASLVVQELRGLVQFWRRVRRGEDVAQLALVGFDPDVARQLEPALQACVPGSITVCTPLEEIVGLAGGLTARCFALDACRVTGPLQPDLGTVLPPRRRTVIGTVLSATVVALMLANAGIVRLKALDRGFRERADQLRRAAGNVELLEETAIESQSALHELEAERERMRRVGSMGIDFEGLAGAVFAAFGEDASLSSLDLNPWGDVGKVQITGTTWADPTASYEVLSLIRKRLEASPRFRDVLVRPPTAIPGPDSRAGLEFALEAMLEESP